MNPPAAMGRRDFSARMVGLAATPPLAGLLSRGQLDEAARLVQAQVDAGRLRAAALLVRHVKTTFARAFGEARSPETIFLIASITKPMTAAGVMVLADRGELALQDPVHKFIPEFDDGDRKQVTVEHLLTHTSGLPDMLPENAELRKRHAPLEEFVERAIRTPLLFKPGSKYSYQSMGILLASEIARRITRMPFPKFLGDQVFKPLGMTRTALGLGRFKIAETASCQVEQAAPEGGGVADADWNWNSPYWRGLGVPWGGAHSTCGDITAFLESFLHPEGKVLKPETAASMVADHTPGLAEHRGLGFAVGSRSFGAKSSPRTFGHGGSTGTIACADPRSGLTCVLLTTLPARVSQALLLDPVCDVVSGVA